MRTLTCVLLALACSCPATAAGQGDTNLPPSSEASRAEISAVVLGQIDAIKVGDWPRAYTFAASGIREKFDLAGFEAMIRSTYPPLLVPRVATALRASDNGVQAVLELRVLAGSGILAHYRYFLQLEDAAWRIVGVVPYEPPGMKT